MENRTRNSNNNSGDKFSFPVIMPVQEGQEMDFEFGFSGSVSPGSPKSPADHLFFNGRLLPHYFPSQQVTNINSPSSFSRSMSRTSSVSSRDSLWWSSRSNSTNSRSSCSSSSARTSTSESSERKLLSQGKNSAFAIYMNSSKYMNSSSTHYTGVSPKWQFIVTPAPVMKKNGQFVSKSQKKSPKGCKSLKSRKQRKENGNRKVRFWFLRRVLKKFMSACRECHAMEPTRREKHSRR
ncbi:putative membrane-associated kinase regulator 3 [Capsicum chacoense]